MTRATFLLALLGAIAAVAAAAATHPIDNSILESEINTDELPAKAEEPNYESTLDEINPELSEVQAETEEKHTVTKRAANEQMNDGINQNSLSQDEEGRSKKRKDLLRRIIVPMFLSIGVMTLPVLFGLVALAAFKGLWSGMAALAVTAALALRRLFATNHSVWVPPPQPPPNHHFTEYYTDYRRADDYNDKYGWRALP